MDAILGGDNSDKALALKEQIRQAIENHLGNPKDPIYKRSINLQFWNLVSYIIKRKLQTQKLLPGDSVLFTRSEQIAIDYGYISDKLVDGVKEFNTGQFFDDALVSTITIDPSLKYYSITSWLNEQLKEFMGFYEIEKLKLQHEKAVSDIAVSKSELETTIKAKKGLTKSIAMGFENKAVFSRIEALTEKIDGVANKYAFIKYKIQSGTTALSKEERLELIGIENVIKTASNERKNLLGDITHHISLSNIEDEIIKKECELLNLISQSGKAKADLEALISSKNSISTAQKEEMFNERISLLKNVLELIAKRSKIEPTPYLSGKLADKIPDKVFQSLAMFIEADPHVFKNKKMKRFGYPSIIFVPGCGNGVYNYDLNALVLPQFPVKDYREQLISAMVLYRWDCDEDREFRDSFSSMKPFKRLSFVDLQRAMILNYTLYILKERQGYKVFDKEIRDWFTYNVAPKKDEVKKVEITKVDPEQRDQAPENLPDQSYEEANYFEHVDDEAGSDGDGNVEVTDSTSTFSAPAEEQERKQQEPPAEPVKETFTIVEVNASKPSEVKKEQITVIEFGAPFKAPGAPAEHKTIPKISAVPKLFDNKAEPDQAAKPHDPDSIQSSAPPPMHPPSPADFTSIPVPPEFEKARKTIYEKIKTTLKAEGIDEKFALVPSAKPGKVDIHLLNIDVYSTELDLLLNTLLIQSKLHKFTDLFKKE